jgi:hypothetical protein
MLEDANAKVERLKAQIDYLWSDAESADPAFVAIKHEVERLKAHSWQQERAAVVAFLDKQKNPLRSSVYFAGKIERGEHWPEGGTP